MKNLRKLLPAAAVLLALPTLAQAQTIDSGDTAWIMTATALVLFMTLPGLALFYGGLVRTKNVLSVLMQCFAICCAISILWLAIGYSMAFSETAAGGLVGGFSNAFFANTGVDTVNGTIPDTVFAMFQLTFAIITPALIVGGFAERMRFSAMLMFSIAWAIVVYFPVTHWVWAGDGWLFARGFRYDREDITRARANEKVAAEYGLRAEIENPLTGIPPIHCKFSLLERGPGRPRPGGRFVGTGFF